ncbi:MAG: hypothetical protein ACO1OO_02990 [Flavisolibacter sp.]
MSIAKTTIWLLCLLLPAAALAQGEDFTSSPNKRGQHSLVLYAGGGVGYYYLQRDALPSHLSTRVQHLHRVGTVRVMWHPDHLLKLGVETGYLTFYRYTFRDSVGNSGKVALTAFPVLIEWSMSVTKRWNVFAGSGFYMLNTRMDYKGKTTAPKLSIGWMAAGSYIQPLSENTGLGAEVKWLDAAESADGTLVLQLQLVWKFFKW